MTVERVATEWVESLTTTGIKARVAAEWVEAVTSPHIKARVAAEWVEIIVGGPAGGWSVGRIRVG